MPIENIPEIYLDNQGAPELLVYDFKMTNDVVKSKVQLSMNMFSFLQIGRKQIHFAGTSIAVNKEQSLLIKKGNSLWTELLETEEIYFCKLLFFSEKKLATFLKDYPINKTSKKEAPFFVIENDAYILTYINSLSAIEQNLPNQSEKLLAIKFEEILVYLINKYGDSFELFLHSLVNIERFPFRSIIEKNVYSNLKLEEIAFLCNMSISTFKRHFLEEYEVTPGKWFKEKRLLKAKELLKTKQKKPSEIFREFGYNNLSNFSLAFKQRFGVSPKEVS